MLFLLKPKGRFSALVEWNFRMMKTRGKIYKTQWEIRKELPK